MLIRPDRRSTGDDSGFSTDHEPLKQRQDRDSTMEELSIKPNFIFRITLFLQLEENVGTNDINYS